MSRAHLHIIVEAGGLGNALQSLSGLAASGCSRRPIYTVREPMQALADVLLRQGRQGRSLRRLIGGAAIRRMAQSLWRDEGGTATLETVTLMLPLILVVGGVYEFSWIFHKQKLI